MDEMDCSLDGYSDLSESEVDDLADVVYKQLKLDGYKCNPDGTWRCPFCKGKRKLDYKYNEILQHAAGQGKSTKRLRETAKHRALEKYLKRERDHPPQDHHARHRNSSSSLCDREHPSLHRGNEEAGEGRYHPPPHTSRINSLPDHHHMQHRHRSGSLHDREHPSLSRRNEEAGKGRSHPPPHISRDGSLRDHHMQHGNRSSSPHDREHLSTTHRNEEAGEGRYYHPPHISRNHPLPDHQMQQKNHRSSPRDEEQSHISHSNKESCEERFVWPWMAVLVNIPKEGEDGSYVGGANRIKEHYAKFNPVKVHPLWDYRGFRGMAIVHFGKDWVGYHNVMEFHKYFLMHHHGKRDWIRDGRQLRSSPYGWIAREDDFFSSDEHIRKHLLKHGNLKIIRELQEEEGRKKECLFNKITKEIEAKAEKTESTLREFNELDSRLKGLLQDLEKREMETEKLEEEHRKAMDETRENQQNMWKSLIEETNRCRDKLKKERETLQERQMALEQREAQNEYEKQKLEEEKDKFASEDAQLQEDDVKEQEIVESIRKLMEEHQREKEKHLSTVHAMEKELEERQMLELEIEKLSHNLQLMIHMEGDDEKKTIEAVKKQLEEKEAQFDEMTHDLTNTLIKKQRYFNDEVQDARKELISGFRSLFSSDRVKIGTKRMGELDDKPFLDFCRKKFPNDSAGEEALILSSTWAESIKDPHWHPFKILDDGDHAEEVINEDDEKLKGLREEYGEDVYKAVTTAKLEVNEYNPSGGYVVHEIWNFKENRRASLAEAIEYLANTCKQHKKRKR